MKKSLIKIGSSLLLLIFTVIQVLPIFHHHSDSVDIAGTSVSDKVPAQHTIDISAEDCLICSFLAHKQIDHPTDFTAISISTFTAKAITLNADYCQQLFETAVHTWTNKGPPTV